MNVALVVSEFNGKITSRMESAAKERAEAAGVSVVRTVRASGAFDVPPLADALLARPDVDAVVALGAVIRGRTRHDEVIAHAVASQLCAMSVKRGKPVGLGISGPGMDERQAYARIRPVAERAVDAVASSHAELARARA